jgi:hypothetical protein
MAFVFRKIQPIFLIALLTAMVIGAVARQNTAQNPIMVLKQYFESRGFKTGTILLPYLNVRVKLENNCFYRKEEGAVDLNQRINEIRAGFGLRPYTDTVRCCGWCGVVDSEYNGRKAYGYVVLIKKNLNPPTRIYTHAHENGHFLWYIGKQEKIYQKFKNPHNIRLKISTNDEFAELCGWFALKLAGYDLDKCTIQWHGKRESSDINKIKKLVRDDPPPHPSDDL